MKGLIIACGEKDSEGRDRTGEPRGLLRFGGREVVAHSLEKMHQAGVTHTVLLTEEVLANRYREALRAYPYQVSVETAPIPNMPSIVAYAYGVTAFGNNEPVIAVADDNLFTFSFDKLLFKYAELTGNILAVRDERFICESSRDMNFGRVSLDREGRIVNLNHSFSKSQAIASPLISLDMWLFNPHIVSRLKSKIFGNIESCQFAREFLQTVYCVEMNHGFWADVGKPRLRLKAEQYFRHHGRPSITYCHEKAMVISESREIRGPKQFPDPEPVGAGCVS